MPELRIDPIIGRRVYIAEDRAGRPSDYVAEPLRGSFPASERPGHVKACYFCAGNEAHTPVASAEVRDAQGRWQVRVVPNKYPALALDQPDSTAYGAHEVIIESPDHVLDLLDMDGDQLAVILVAYRDRLRHWANDSRLKHAIVFKNSGVAAGASLEHVHSQLVALPYVTAAVQAELDGTARYYEANKRCVFCDLIKRETADRERLVLHQDGYAAICAYAPRQPFETWILPVWHEARFDLLDDAELSDQSRVLYDVLHRLRVASSGAAYNLLLHTSPFSAAEYAYHWHWELVPRITHEAGLEWGAGVYITPLSPERAAAQLRAAT
jgi:UDPglucose--hexose-1-phosphate uridylyltransferase